MNFIFVFLMLAAILGLVWHRSIAKKNTLVSYTRLTSSKSNRPTNKRVHLTDNQIVALRAASFDKPIYGENPSLMNAQMPNNSACFNLRTIESLVEHGYLKSDGKGGYLLTPEGMKSLRRA